jgi:mono/diheme cytochrome c family protein
MPVGTALREPAICGRWGWAMNFRSIGWFMVAGWVAPIFFGPRAVAASVDCNKPVAPCTACHSPLLTRDYAMCLTQPWTAPASAKELKSPIPTSPKTIGDGKANYGIFCEGCHGEKGDGVGPIAMKFGIPVANLTMPVVQQQTDGELFWKISHGRGAMPMWADVLTNDDRWELTTFIRSFKKPL